MKIYIGHSRDFDYEKELYLPIRTDSELEKNVFVLPHENGRSMNWGREFYDQLDLFIAEVSFPGTGLGIELGWAYDSKVPIVCISKRGVKVSSSLRAVSDQFYEYSNPEELCQVIKSVISDAQ